MAPWLDCSAQISIWFAPTTGNWTTGADWTSGVPNSSTVIAELDGSGAYTVTMNTSEAVGILDQLTGTLLVSNTSLYLDGSLLTSVIAGTVQLNSGAIYGSGGVLGHTVLVTGAVQALGGGASYLIGNGSGNPLLVTNAGSVTSSGGSTLDLGYYSGDNVINTGSIVANGGTVNLGGPNGAWSNSGTIQATNGGIVNFGGSFTTAQMTDVGLGVIDGMGGTLNLIGSLNNALATLPAPNDGGTFTLVYGASITGGTVNGGTLAFSNGGTLSGVGMVGNFAAASGQSFTAGGGTVFSTGTTTFANNVLYVGSGSPSLTVASDEIWTGDVSIYANTTGAKILNNGTITNTAGGNTIFGDGSTGFVFTNAGTVSATAGSLTIGENQNDSVINNAGAMIKASGGASVSVGLGSDTVTNNGTLEATGASSVLTLGSGTSTWANNTGASIIAAVGGTVNLGGTFATSNLQGVGTGTINGAGGFLDITGSLNNASGGPLVAPSGGLYTLVYGGMITGGTVDGGALTFGNGGTLNGVSMTGNFSAASGATFTAENHAVFQTGTTTFTNNAIYVGPGSPGITVAFDGIWTGDVSVYASAANASMVNNGVITNTSGGNTFFGDGNNGFVFTNNRNVAATGGSLTIGENQTDSVVNNSGASIEAAGGATVSLGLGSDTVTNAGVLEATGASSVLNLGSGTSTWTNVTGASIIASAGGTVNLGGVFSTSSLQGVGVGMISSTGGTLNIVGSLDNTSGGPLAIPNGGGIYTLAYGGMITGGTVNGGALTFSNGGTLNGVTMTGNFSAPSGADFTATNQTLFQTGTTTFANNSMYAGAGSTALTIASDETWTGNVSIYASAPSVTVVNYGTITNTSGGNTFFGDGQSNFTFTNNGTVSATGGSLTVGENQNDAVVNDSGATIKAMSGATVSLGLGTDTVTNYGVLMATGASSVLDLGSASSTWTNKPGASIDASSGGTVNLGGLFSTSNLQGVGAGTIDGIGGSINIAGSLDNSSGGPLTMPNGGGVYTLVYGGMITSGVVDGGALTFGNGGTLSGVTLTGNFSAPTSASFTAKNQTLFQTGTTTFANNLVFVGAGAPGLTIAADEIWTGNVSIFANAPSANVVNDGMILNTSGGNTDYGGGQSNFVFTNNGTVSVTGGSLTIGENQNDSVVNNAGATLEVSNGANLAVGLGSDTVANYGTLEASGASSVLTLGSGTSTWANNTGASIIATGGGTVVLGGLFSTSNLQGVGTGTINGAGGTLEIEGTLNNTSGGPLVAPGGGGIYTLVYGGTITGGTVNGGALTFGNGGTLSGVTMTGNFTVPTSATFAASNGTVFQAGTTTLPNSVVTVGAGATGLTIASNANWTGSFGVYGGVPNATFVNDGAMANTSASTNYIYGGGYSGFSFTNNGTVEALNGAYIVGEVATDSVTNGSAGTMEAGGGALYLDTNNSTTTNLASNTLTGGTWIAASGGVIYFANNSNAIATNDATLVLSGSTSNIKTLTGAGSTYQTVDQTLATNNGSLEVLGGRNFAATNAIVNNGLIQLGGGNFTAPALTNTSGSQLAGTGSFTPTGGVAVGTGVNVSPGTVGAGTYVGALSFNSLTLGTGGTYTFDLMNATGTAGTDFDTISVTGAATVTAGVGSFTFNLDSINPGTGLPGLANFSSASSYQWTLVSASSVSGFNAADFNINTSAFSNSLGIGGFFLSSNGTDIFLNFTPVPEPSTWALMGAGVAAVAAALFRRRRRLAAA